MSADFDASATSVEANLADIREDAEYAARSRRGRVSISGGTALALIDRLEAAERESEQNCDAYETMRADWEATVKRAEAAEATIARVEDLPERWRADGDGAAFGFGAAFKTCAEDLEAALKGES